MNPNSRLRAVLIGGTIGGTLDILFALTFAAVNGMGPVQLLQTVASGLLGEAAYSGGIPVAALGLVGHFGDVVFVGRVVRIHRGTPAQAHPAADTCGRNLWRLRFLRHATRRAAALGVPASGHLQAAFRQPRPPLAHVFLRRADRPRGGKEKSDETSHRHRRHLLQEGCNVLDKTDDSEYGKFGWVMDRKAQGELWQPPAGS